MEINQQMEDYCSLNSMPEAPYLTELERETHIKTVNPRMLSGQLQGRFLSMISKIVRPERILEIGTFTAYSALCLAEGLSPNGTLDTIEINRELRNLIVKYVQKSPFRDRIRVHFGDALEIIDRLEGPFDLVFIDAGKEQYPEYYAKVKHKVRRGGLILVDNVLWSGKVYTEPQDDTARIIHRFNRQVRQDPGVEIVMLPLRDGISLIRKLTD
jgi:predicted O-methyltransferase YrrM